MKNILLHIVETITSPEAIMQLFHNPSLPCCPPTFYILQCLGWISTTQGMLIFLRAYIPDFIPLASACHQIAYPAQYVFWSTSKIADFVLPPCTETEEI